MRLDPFSLRVEASLERAIPDRAAELLGIIEAEAERRASLDTPVMVSMDFYKRRGPSC